MKLQEFEQQKSIETGKLKIYPSFQISSKQISKLKTEIKQLMLERNIRFTLKIKDLFYINNTNLPEYQRQHSTEYSHQE